MSRARTLRSNTAGRRTNQIACRRSQQIFATAGDPVALGLVASLNRPGGNVTGVSNLGVELTPKQLQLLRDLTPNATLFGVLVDPTFPTTQSTITDLQAAARTLGLQLLVANART